jgi:hypothetical protein
MFLCSYRVGYFNNRFIMVLLMECLKQDDNGICKLNKEQCNCSEPTDCEDYETIWDKDTIADVKLHLQMEG